MISIPKRLSTLLKGIESAEAESQIRKVLSTDLITNSVIEFGLENPSHFAVFSQLNVRWIIPAKPRLLSPLTSWRPYGFFGGVAWALFLIGYRTTRFAFLPIFGVPFTVTTGRQTNHEGSSEDFHQQSLIYVSAPSKFQKAVIFVPTSENGTHKIRVLKVPLVETAKVAIDNEIRCYQELYDRGLASSHVGGCRGGFSMDYIEGHPSGTHFNSSHADYLLRLKNHDDVSIKGFIEHSRDQASQYGIYLTADYLYEKFAKFGIDVAARMPSYMIHGDFCPWNIKVKAAKIYPVDWEDGHVYGLPFWDMIHFVISVDCRLKKTKKFHPKIFKTFACKEFISRVNISHKGFEAVLITYIFLQQKVSREKGDVIMSNYLSGYLGRENVA